MPSYFNLRKLSDKNECFCCGPTCHLVDDPEYEAWTIQYPAPTTPPVPPLPDYETQGVGQRCAEPGTLQTIFTPPTQEQCWRLSSYKDGVPQPNTYFNLKTSADPDECYCVVRGFGGDDVGWAMDGAHRWGPLGHGFCRLDTHPNISIQSMATQTNPTHILRAPCARSFTTPSTRIAGAF